MNSIKRKVKNIVRNIIMSDALKNTSLIKNMRAKRQAKLDAERKRLFDLYGQECLELIKDTLDKENIQFWLDFGTLLGAMREKDFIAHDLDVDLGMFQDEETIKRAEEALAKVGIKKIREFKIHGKVSEQTYEYKGMLTDMFYYFTDEKTMWTYSFSFSDCKLEKKNFENRDESTGFNGGIKLVNNKRGVETLMFKGREYFVPENPVGYLIENYGPGYKEPVKEWDYMNSPTNRIAFKEKDIIMVEYY